jgi:hypothetical protein
MRDKAAEEPADLLRDIHERSEIVQVQCYASAPASPILSTQSVIAPRLLLETTLAYFASTPY